MAALTNHITTEVHFNRRTLCYATRPPNFNAMVARSVELYPDKVALVCGDRQWTYSELMKQAQSFAATISRDYGIAKGDRIAVLTGNVPEFAIAAIGVSLLGAILVPLNTQLKTSELQFILHDSGSLLLIATPTEWPKVARIRDNLPRLRGVFSTQSEPAIGVRAWDELLLGGEPPRVSVHEEDAIYLCYTSGTTGLPKGALLTHFNLAHSLINYEQVMDITSDDVTLLGVPIFHVTGLIAQFALFLYIGGKIVLGQTPFRPGWALELMESERITHFFGVPTIYIMLMNHADFGCRNLSTLRLVASGGAPLPSDVAQRWAARLPRVLFLNFYGLTETTSPATYLHDSFKLERPGSAGRPLPVTEVNVIKEDGDEVNPGQVGELTIRGPMIFKGYWHNDEATTKAFLPDGWFRTGDMARIDDDGFVHIMDRKKDMVNRAGEKIYCTELENCLTSHPAVLEAAVVGQPDDFYGEVVRAVVVLRPGECLTASQLQSHVRVRLADYKVPAVVDFVDELPRNPGGKVMKNLLRG